MKKNIIEGFSYHEYNGHVTCSGEREVFNGFYITRDKQYFILKNKLAHSENRIGVRYTGLGIYVVSGFAVKNKNITKI